VSAAPRRGRRPSARPLAERVRSAKGRKPGSTRWLQRQLNDPYVAEAKRAGYRSRAAWKLVEIDDRFKLLTPGATVLDLGAAPGGWSQVAAERVARGRRRGRVVAVDLSPIAPLAGVAVHRIDALAAPEALAALVPAGADVVLSDMAAPATGHRATDHLRSLALCEAALATARAVLRPGGALVCKLRQGSGERDVIAALRRAFATVRQVKPEASRSESAETYLVALGFRAPDPRGAAQTE